MLIIHAKISLVTVMVKESIMALDIAREQQMQGFFAYSKTLSTLWMNFLTTTGKQLEQTQQTMLSCYQNPSFPLLDSEAARDYLVDVIERSVLFWDIIRERGNQYLQHDKQGQPPVLIFKYTILIDGRNFPKPVNYALVKIIPPAHLTIDDNKRPFVIVDPRAGHGAGISGFKDESQVGIAMQAGHPVYVVIFFPLPEPAQTLMDVTMAHETFLQAVAQRHPNSPKPCVVGNCQGGWAVLSLMAAHPDIAGVCVINGAPLSYWSGEDGKNPMRYIGGIVGGSWLSQLAGDLGHGKFDGANLVLNFELANPQVVYGEKYYHLFANIDEEAERFLNFERWWGGFSLLNANEMRGIVDNLFIGNKLVHGKIPLGDCGDTLDLRDLNVPVIVFCSEGDSITPPQQALNWISDLYSNTLEIKLGGQVIVYLVHESVGHLGIFVSSAVAKKEHRQIIDLLNYVEHLAPGLYELTLKPIQKNAQDGVHYQAFIHERTIDDIRPSQSVQTAVFNRVRLVSEYNATSYDFFMGPFVRFFSNEMSAEFVRKAHPLRQSRYLLSDINPFLSWVKWIAPSIRENRHPIMANNPYLKQQETMIQTFFSLWQLSTQCRDNLAELIFYSIYSYIECLVPFDPYKESIVHDGSQYAQNQLIQSISQTTHVGDIPEAIIRILLLLAKSQGYVIGQNYPDVIRKMKENPYLNKLNQEELKNIVRHQTVIIEHNQQLALTSLPLLLKNRESAILVLNAIEEILSCLDVSPSKNYKKMFHNIQHILLSSHSVQTKNTH